MQLHIRPQGYTPLFLGTFLVFVAVGKPVFLQLRFLTCPVYLLFLLQSYPVKSFILFHRHTDRPFQARNCPDVEYSVGGATSSRALRPTLYILNLNKKNASSARQTGSFLAW
jgi:hypothetical protein